MDDAYRMALGIVVVAVAVVALVTVAKHLLAIWRGPHALDTPRMQSVLHVAPLVLGVGLALVPGVFAAEVGVRVLLGLIAGFCSPTIYRELKARLPRAMLAGELPARADPPFEGSLINGARE